MSTFHPLSVLSHVPSAIALETDLEGLVEVLTADAVIWGACSNRARFEPVTYNAGAAPFVSACAYMLGVSTFSLV